MKTRLQKLLKIRGIKFTIEICLILLVFTIIKTWMQRNMIEGTPPAIQASLLDGKHFDLQSIKGKTTLVHFWATWCGICKLEQDSINAISKAHTVITIAMKSGNATEIRQYMLKHKLSFPVIVDAEGHIAKQYGVQAVPASFIINPQGKISFRETGYTSNWGLRIRLWLAGFNATSSQQIP